MSLIDLGQIAAIKVGGEAPLNKKLLWYDDQATSERLRWKYFDPIANQWEPLAYALGSIEDSTTNEGSTWSSAKIAELINNVGVFKEDITVRLSEGKSIGAYTNGQIIPAEGKTIAEVFEMLAKEPLAPTLSLQPIASILEVGFSGQVAVEWIAKSLDDKPLSEITIGNNTLIPTGQLQQSGTIDVTPTVNDGVWILTGRAATSNASVITTVNVEFAYPLYYHDGKTTIPLTSVGIIGEATKVLASKNLEELTWQLKADSTKMYVCVPSTKRLVSIVDQSNLNMDLTSQFTSQYITIDGLQAPTTYILYTLELDASYGSTTTYKLRFE